MRCIGLLFNFIPLAKSHAHEPLEVSLLLPRAPAETTPLSFLTALLFD